MDYFSELLESYSKLKKRTYKITFISEQEEPIADPDALKRAQQAADNVIGQPYDSFAAGNQASPDGVFAYKKARTEDISVAIGGNTRAGGTVAPGGSLDKNSDAYKKLVNHFLKQEQGDEQALEVQTEAERRRTVEGSLEDPEYVDLIPQATRIMDRLKSLAREGFLGDITEAEVQGRYIVTGNSENSTAILAKITSAEVRTVDEDGLSSESKMSPAMAAKILDNFEAITTFIAVPEDQTESACEDVKRQVGFYKNQLILFGNDPQELLVVGSNKAPNKLFQIGLNAIEEKCGFTKKDFTKVAGSVFSTQEKNAVKGTMFEAVHTFAALLAKGDIEEAKKGLVAELQSKAKILKNIQADRKNAGLTLDEAFAQVVQEELLEALGNDEKLKEYLITELSLALPFAKFMDADEVRPVGLEVATGAREDLDYIYSDQEKAYDKAEAIGSEVRVIGPNQYAVGVGLKRLTKIERAKFGEINSMRRMLEILAGGGKGKNLDPEFGAYMYKSLFNYSTSREVEASRYGEGLEESVAKTATPFMENTTYSKGGKIKATTPEELAKSTFNSLKRKLGFKDLRNSALRDTLFEKKGDEYVLKDFSGDGPSAEDNRNRLGEKVARLDRMTKLRKDIEGGNEAARDYVLGMAFVCGANTRNMAQLISDDSGEVLSVRHNDILTDIANSDDLNFSFEGTKIKITGGGSTVILDQSHTSTSAGKSSTRTSLYVPKETLENYSSGKFNPKKGTREEITKLFIQGQINLLEELLKQTNDNPLL